MKKSILTLFVFLLVSLWTHGNDDPFTNSIIFDQPTSVSTSSSAGKKNDNYLGNGNGSTTGKVKNFTEGTVISHDVKRMKGKKGYTHIVLVLDASGSMSPYKNVMVEACSKFLKTQSTIPGSITIDVWVFSSRARSPYIEKIINFEKLTKKNYLEEYECSGLTPLFDASFTSIKDLEKRIKKLSKSRKNPETVIFVIVSDGADNLSVHSPKDVSDKIFDHIEEWNFLMLGIGSTIANIGPAMGLPSSNCFNVLLNEPSQVKVVWDAINEFSKRSRTQK